MATDDQPARSDGPELEVPEAPGGLGPPVAPRRPHVLVAHGDERVDDWWWLRSDTRDDPDVLAHLEAENSYTKAALAHTDDLQARLFEEIRSRIKETDLDVPFRKDGWWYYSRTEEGLQYPINCRRQGSLDAVEQVILDENVVAGEHEFFALGAFDISPAHGLLLYSTDYDGSERFTMKVRDLATGADREDEIPATYYGTAWVDDQTFFYVMTDATMRPHQVWRHVLGTGSGTDVCMFEEADERFFVDVRRAKSGNHVFIHTGSKMSDEWWVLPTADPQGAFGVIEPREQGLEYSVTDAGDRFLIVTNADGAVNFKVMAAPVDSPGRTSWEQVEAHRPEVKIEGLGAFAHHIVMFERAEALLRIRVVRRSDGAGHVVAMPEAVYSAGDGGNPEYDSDTLRFTYTSLVTPRSVFDYGMDTRERELKKQTEVLGGYDPSRYTSGRHWAVAADGTRVPISLVHRADLPAGPNPCLICGYGSYEYSLDPGFSSLRLTLIDRGFVFAVAHVRGGGEMGRPWYEQGRLEHKRNTFTDFVACARHLVEEGYTTPGQLVARGGSAGGLLMGAVANLDAPLFAAIVAEVPFVDCLTTMLDETIPLTVTEWEEWGNPVTSPEMYAYMKSYSPYDNVTEQGYPAILATTGLNDSRVAFWEPAKWVQKLRASTTGGRPVYLKTEMGAGHGGASGRYDAWKDEAFIYAFILDTLGLA